MRAFIPEKTLSLTAQRDAKLYPAAVIGDRIRDHVDAAPFRDGALAALYVG
jgi:hypothetical protein